MRRVRQRWIWLEALFCVALLALGGIWEINAGMVRYAAQYTVEADEAESLPQADCVLVLGALVHDNEQLSGVLQDRMDTAIALYEAGRAKRLLLSGDHGRRDYDEVNAMMDYALQHGVPKEDIFLDHAGFSTYESMYRARDIFCVKSVIIVTQQVNLYRAIYDARRLGLDAYGVDADLHIYGNEKTQALRESLARVKDCFYVSVWQPEPTYLGDAIPIWGNSALTHDRT